MQFHILFVFVCLMFSVGGLAIGFEVELIHRDSPLSPLYDPSATAGERARGAVLRSLARFNRMGPREKSVESIITMAGGEFLMAFLIGTPPLTTYAIVDTGSDLIWIQCPPCIYCFPQNSPLFDPTKSSTYNKVQCGSPSCGSNCTIPNEECRYNYNYGDGSSTSGVLATESFRFQTVKRGVGVNATKIVFGCGNNNMGTFSDGGSGIIGLGRGSLSLISQLGVNLERRFSYCFPKSAEISSTLKFGVNASFSGIVLSTPLLKDDSHPSYFFVKLEGISVGSKRIATKEVNSGKGNTIIDSGTTLNLLKPELYLSVIATTREIIGLPTVIDPTLVYEFCYETESLKNISLPTFTYHFTGGDIELKNFNVFTSYNDLTCLAMASSDQDFSIYGNVAQKNFEVECNLESQIISFAPAECSWKGGAGNEIQTYSLIASTICIFLILFLVF